MNNTKRLAMRVAVSLASALTTLFVAAWWLLRTPHLEVPVRAHAVLANVTLISPLEGQRSGQDVHIRHGRIVRIQPHVPGRISRPGAPPVLARGGFVLPGLIDMHVHYPPRLALGQQSLWSLLFLAHGVTTVRELGSVDESSLALRTAIRTGRTIGPNLFTCGRMLDGPVKVFPSNVALADSAAALAAVRERKHQRTDCVKLYTLLTSKQVQVIMKEARRLNLPALGHLPHSVDVTSSGLKELQHLMGFPPVDRQLVRHAEHRLQDWAHLDAERIRERVALMKRLGVTHVPNLINARQRLMYLDPSDWENDSALRHLPRYWIRTWKNLWDPPYPRGRKDLHTAWRRKAGIITRQLFRAGVPVYAGSDTLMPFVGPGSSLHGELQEMMRAGLRPEEALATATTIPGRWFASARGGVRGQLKVGAAADLLLTKTNPLHDRLQSLRTPELVITNGRVYSRRHLSAALRRYDDHFLRGPYRLFMNAIVDAVAAQFARAHR